MPITSAMPEQKAHAFSSFDSAVSASKEKEIFDLIAKTWPTTPLEIAMHFKEDLSSRGLKKRASTKYAYYLKKLVEKRLVLSKRAGNGLIVWPLKVEKYRAIHSILESDL